MKIEFCIWCNRRFVTPHIQRVTPPMHPIARFIFWKGYACDCGLLTAIYNYGGFDSSPFVCKGDRENLRNWIDTVEKIALQICVEVPKISLPIWKYTGEIPGVFRC